MFEKDIKLVEDAFKKYYFDHFDLIHVPKNPSEREFGYQKFNFGMKRHITIKDDKELHLLLIQNVPSDVYCSNAYYSFPNLPMTEKDWKSADLIFDIDAKDLKLSCRETHTCVKCNSCEKISKSNSSCPHCQSTKIEKISTVCTNCINEAKNEVQKLIKLLINDLDIQNNNIEIYFSGNEGFHVYVSNSSYGELSSRERTELVDYLMFKGVIPETFGFHKFKPERSNFPEFDEEGWRGRISKELFGTKSKRSKAISQIISDGYSTFQQQLELMKDSVGVKIDPNVTMDIHRIFRLGGSLNSKSGLSKIKCQDLDKFNPYVDACFIHDENVDVLASCPNQFTLKNQKFGPYDNEKISVPTYAAVYMMCKGLATAS